MTQGRALAMEVNEGARRTTSLSSFIAKGAETVLRLGLEAPQEVDKVHIVGE